LSPPVRIDSLILKKIKPVDRPEQDVAGYRDVLSSIPCASRPVYLSLATHFAIFNRQMYRLYRRKGGPLEAKKIIPFRNPKGWKTGCPVSAGFGIENSRILTALCVLFKKAKVLNKKTDPLF